MLCNTVCVAVPGKLLPPEQVTKATFGSASRRPGRNCPAQKRTERALEGLSVRKGRPGLRPGSDGLVRLQLRCGVVWPQLAMVSYGIMARTGAIGLLIGLRAFC